ncbi:MAG: CPBP family intramembrane metalloprotease [Kiritimatiellae bacterium]|nr:CPBP family intramembrane metalloprotease [Kiritimatiellia bacterium]
MTNHKCTIKVTAILCLLIFGSLMISSLLATWVYQCLGESSGWLSDMLLSRGPHKLMRRFLMIFLLLTLPVVLGRYCWNGFNDMAIGPRIQWETLCRGLILGLISLGMVAIYTAFKGYRVYDASLDFLTITLKLSRYFLSAIVIGFLEETLTRGILFRSLARLWKNRTAALVTSICFAIGHFATPSPEAFNQDGSIIKISLNVLISMWETALTHDFVWLQILNLTLMGYVLCIFVARYGTIWFAAGLHAGWAWIKLANSFLMDINFEKSHSLWLGHRSDNLDSLLCMLMLTLFLVGASRIPIQHVEYKLCKKLT